MRSSRLTAQMVACLLAVVAQPALLSTPIVGRAGVWYGMWNPVTNYVRFAVLMIGIVLLGVWMVDVGRMYYSMRDRMGAG
ncbi:MAG: hypothetical protein NTU53_19025 [Planctomycetota bacterium]|nr:hypothetical protein [Planctomycetota bacterium]